MLPDSILVRIPSTSSAPRRPTVETDVDPQAAAEAAVAESADDVSGEEIAEAMPEETIDLTDPSLTAGIPGELKAGDEVVYPGLNGAAKP